MVWARPMDDVPGLLGGWRGGGVDQPRRVRRQGAIRRRCELARAELSGVRRGGSGRDAQAVVADPQAAVEALLDDDRPPGPAASIAPRLSGSASG